ncbi:NAD(P)/FAD-dependent oxidoreductase [Ornithinimicrobium sp. W1679]|uniref:NAD(P)/FAD-dependent oxidoreductase n=1 Tax=Ornithinimicrobium sp. W1679 TaxID=3418770 RepID=UPI003CF2D5EC
MSGTRRVAVVGAGMVGLATAWHLQAHGVEVTVLDREGVAAGASWGNAGWLTPAMATPLPEPAVLRYGVRALVNPGSPVYLPPRADPQLLRFVGGFVRHSTMGRWERAMRSLLPLNDRALDAFDHLVEHGVDGTVRDADPLMACYTDVRHVKVLLDEFRHIARAGGHVDHELISGQEARRREPAVSEAVEAAVLIRGQRFLDPVRFVAALADSVRHRGGSLLTRAEVTGLVDRGDHVELRTRRGEQAGGGHDGDSRGTGDGGSRGTDDRGSRGTDDGGAGRYDAVVVATGAWLGDLVAPFGVRHVVQAGRGYSFSVEPERVPAGPLYLPEARVAVTPLGDRVRVAGMMEFRRPDEPLDPRRIRAIVDSVRPMLAGIPLDDRQDEWVGSRPVTADGLPLVGRTTSERVFVAGGHGMWGITLGPVTGHLLAEQIVTGRVPPELRPLDPLRRIAWAPSRAGRRPVPGAVSASLPGA